jgi:GT2 family glycosyltransferase/glycosyltransferase involved in cell wall biosynthesis
LENCFAASDGVTVLTLSSTVLKKIALFQPYNWESAFPVLRVTGPWEALGQVVLQGNTGAEVNYDAITAADIVVIQRDFPKNQPVYDQITRLARQQDKPVIYDIDDLLLELPPKHPDRQNFFYTDALLPIFQAIRLADAVTTTTLALANYLKSLNERVFVLPNYLNDQIWDLNPIRSKPTENKKIVIGYMGSESHKSDLELISPALIDLNQRFPERLQFHFWGLKPTSGLSVLPNVEWTPLAIYNYRNFAAYFQEQRADIFIAPLQDNLFNRCKSSIKFLEYGALGVPGVYSDIATYRNIVEHGENGFLANSITEWADCLAQLISDQDLRRNIAIQAQKTINSEWLLSKNAPQWLEVYQQVQKKSTTKHQEHPFIDSIAQQIQEQSAAHISELINANQNTIDHHQSVISLEEKLQEATQKNQELGTDHQNLVLSIQENQIRATHLEQEILNLEKESAILAHTIEQLEIEVQGQHAKLRVQTKELSQLSAKLDTEEKKRLSVSAELQTQQLIGSNLNKKLKNSENNLQQVTKKLHGLEYQFSDQNSVLVQERQQRAGIEKSLQAAQQERADLFAQTNQQIYDLTVSREYQHGVELIRLVDRLAPIGSPQKRLISAGYDFLAKFKQRISKPNILFDRREQSQVSGKNQHYDVIVFPIINWDFRYQRPQQIAAQFALQGYRVFYLNHDFHGDVQASVANLAPNIFEVRLPGGPINIYADRMSKTHLFLLMRTFQSLKIEYGITAAISIVDFPFWEPVVRELRKEYSWPVIYDCMDDHSGFSTSSAHTLAAEDKLLMHSDLTITTSNLLYQKKSTITKKCIFLPNAGQFEHFSNQPKNTPHDLAGIEGPIIGYYGAIAEWFDTELVAQIAAQKKHWQFVLIGNTAGADLEPFAGLQNIHLLGEKNYADLPAYLHRFAVCFIPFKRTPLTEATNPVKLFEYMAAGKPVVATRLNEIQNYAEFITLAESGEQWNQALEEAISASNPSEIAARINFAKINTWRTRVQELKSHVGDLFPKACIVVLTYNNKAYTQQCVQSVIERTHYPNYELIIVDNASTDSTPNYLKKIEKSRPNIKVILNQSNLGFSAGNNQGAKQASGEYLIFLNNDIVVTNGWLSRLVYHLHHPKVGLVGPVTNWSGNETRIKVDYANIEDMPDFAQKYTHSHWDQNFEIQVLPFHCIAMRQSVFREVGFLDEQFGIGMFEDDDYALRVRKKSYKVICAEDVFVHHWGKASFSRLDDDIYQALFAENQKKFETKWGQKWIPHKYRS